MLTRIMTGLLAVATILAAGPATAQPVIEAEPLAVTVPVATETVNAFGASVTRIERRQIEQSGALDLQTALRRATGISVSRFNSVGAFGGGEGGSVYIRGRGTGRPGGEIRAYTDGVPREVGVWGHPLLDTLPLRHANRIAIYKGPQPVLYGGVFGAFDMETPRRETTGFETVTEAAVGEFDTWLLALRHGGRIGPTDYYGGVSHLETAGHRPHAGGIQRAQFARAGYAVNDTLHLAYILHRTDNWSDDPGPEGRPVPVRERFANETLTQSIQLRNRGDRVSGYVIVYHEDGKIRWARDHLAGPGSPPGDANTDWENSGLRALQDVRAGIFTLTGGLDLSREGGATESRTLTGMTPLQFHERYRLVSPVAAVRADIELESLTVTPSAGVRHYRHNRFADETAPQAGLVVRRDDWRLFANAARGIHYPGAYARGVSAGTLDTLEAETLDHLEAGIGMRCPWSGTDLQLTLFRDRIDNQLQRTPAGLVNQRRADIDGLELTAGYAHASGISLYAGLTLLDAADARTPRAPEVAASAGLHLPLPFRFALQLDAGYTGSQYAFNSRDPEPALAEVEKLDSHLTANARLVRSVEMLSGVRGELSLAVENLTNETYAYWPGYPMPRRHVTAGLKIAF